MLLSSLANRISAYKDICNRFEFQRQLATLSIDDINKHAQNLVQMYPTNLEECFGRELIQFRTFVKLFMNEKEDDCSLERFMYMIMVNKNVAATFPSKEVMLHMYLCIMISNCSGEQSLFKLKLIKNSWQTTMSQERLVWLSLMSIESDVLRDINFN